MLSKLGELEGESEIDELEGIHGAGLIQVVGIEDGLGLLRRSTVDVEVGKEALHLLESQVTLGFRVSRAEQVKRKANEQEGGDEVVVLEGAGVGGVRERLEGLHSARGQARVAQTDQEGSHLRSGHTSVGRLSVEQGHSVHQHVVVPEEGTETDRSLTSRIDNRLRVRQDLGRETSEAELGQHSGEVRGRNRALLLGVKLHKGILDLVNHGLAGGIYLLLLVLEAEKKCFRKAKFECGRQAIHTWLGSIFRSHNMNQASNFGKNKDTQRYGRWQV